MASDVAVPGSAPASLSIKRWLVALNVACALGVIAGIAAVPTGSRLVVVGSPFSGPGAIMSIISQAGGRLVNGGAAGWIAVAEGTTADFASRLRASGALLVLDGRLAAACIGIRTS
ncbi:MAG: hypothetical protein R3D65_17515 [Zhengella sp.]|uniref:hypothetical protein n=1 Tax=Zhengella sp. TaxID=2282762 RepID=UPI003526DACA|nr:hypothetical protein [Brucellaceae bacterium]